MKPSYWRRIPGDWKYLLRIVARRPEDDVDAELRFHFDERIAELTMQGASPEVAHVRAREEFGDVDEVRTRLHELGHRATRRLKRADWWEGIVQDFAYAVRGLRRSPGFTIAVVLTIALGLGANAALFSVIDRLMFRPPAYLRNPAQVNRVDWYALLAGRSDIPRLQVSRVRFDNVVRATHAFDAITGFYDQLLSIGAGADKTDRMVSEVTGNFFAFFNARPVQGRFIDAADDSMPTGAPIAVISYSFWRDRFGGRANIIGATLQVASVVRTIVGVAPDGFVGITDGPASDLWIPANSRSFLKMVVQRKQGVSESAASAALTYALLKSWELERAIQPSLQPIAVKRPRAAAVSLFPMRRPEAGPEGRLIPWLAGVGLIVLMIACANVANLLLARALRRRREIAVRLALGINRGRLLMQLLTESLMLATLGGVAGLLMAHWGAEVLRALLMPAGSDTTVMTDGRTLLFAFCAVLAVGILSGLAPAVRALRQDLAGDLKSGVREGSYQRSRTRSTLLVMQVALSTILLVGAGLFERSMAHLRTHGLGYDVDPVLTAAIRTHGTVLNDTALSLLTRRLETEAATIPGVTQAAHGTVFAGFEGEFQPLLASGGQEVNWALFRLHTVGPDFFGALGIRMLRGRAIEANDRKDAPLVAIVSQTSARTLWPGQDAVGKCLRVGLGTKGITDDKIYIAPDTAPCRTVIGVAEDIKHESFVNDPGLQYYLPTEQWRSGYGGIVIRVSGAATHSAETIRRRLQRLMPGNGEVVVTTMSDGLASQMKPWRLGETLFTAFGCLALVVAAVGLFAVIAYNVEQRSQELGVRIAFGAESADVLGLVVGQAMRFALVGVAIGGAIALGAGRWMHPLLFEESPGDPAVYAVVAAMLFAVALAASAFPAFRAARTDPNLVLRSE